MKRKWYLTLLGLYHWLLLLYPHPASSQTSCTCLLSTPPLLGCKMTLFRSKPKYYFLFSHWVSLNSLTNKITAPLLPSLFLSRLDEACNRQALLGMYCLAFCLLLLLFSCLAYSLTLEMEAICFSGMSHFL